MWWRKRQSTPEIDANIHWLGQRGLVKDPEISTSDWLKAASGTDPEDLALATIKSRPCVIPSLSYTLDDRPVVDQVGDMADRLQLPIDEARDDASLAIRTGSTWIDIPGGSPLEVLHRCAIEFVDHLHVVLATDSTLALVHRDVEADARQILGL